MYVLGTYVRDVMKLNMESRNFRIFAPDETASNRLQAVFDVTGRRFLDKQIEGIDEHLDPDGRVMDSMLSEHFCEGFLEGYLLTGRHGFFDSYEAFIRIVDSMFSQHAKWLKMCNELPWRHDIASLNYIPCLQRLGSRTTTASRIRTPLPRPRRQQEGRRRAHVSAARSPTACSPALTTASRAVTM